MARPVSDPLRHADSIVAPATAPGAAAIAIVRLSGRDAHRIAHGLTPATEPGDWGRLRRATVLNAERQPTDEALVVFWKGPHSFTGEDLVEFHLHGAPALVESVIAAAIAQGARPADPGEFTRRAFLHGKLDLAQAEAVALLSRSRTDAAARAALAQLSGGLSQKLANIREVLVGVLAQLDATVDYPDEDLDTTGRQRLAAELEGTLREVKELHRSATVGRRLDAGVRIIFAGLPNAGKSSLFNAMLGRERALVTPHPGTTRDTIEATVSLGGIPATLVDTAGLRGAPEEIEALGIARTREELAAADLVLYIVDRSQPAEASLGEYHAVRNQPHLLVLHKADLPPASETLAARCEGAGRIAVVETAIGEPASLSALEHAMFRAIGREEAALDEVLVLNARHDEALAIALEHLSRAQEAIASSISPEFPAVNLAEAITALDRIAPRANSQALDEEVIDRIFAAFCLGK